MHFNKIIKFEEIESKEIKKNLFRLSAYLEQKLANFPLSVNIAVEADNFLLNQIDVTQIEYVIPFKPEEYNLIKDEVDYLIYFIVDNLPILKSGYIKNDEKQFYLIFKQEL